MAEAIGYAGMCTDGVLPVAGGLLDQSAKFIAIWQRLNSEERRIEAERNKR